MSLSKLFLEKYGPEPLRVSLVPRLKSCVEYRIMDASALIRKDPDWAKKLDSKEERHSWSEKCAEWYGTTTNDMDFVFKELEYYKVLHENTPHNMMLGGADMVWTKDIPDSDSLTQELKQYAAVLEAASFKGYTRYMQNGPYFRPIDPFLYPLDYELTRVLLTPLESPEQALDINTVGDKPGSFKAWADIVAGLNPEIAAVKGRDIYKNYNSVHYEYANCWLPTDIRVNVDGSVTIKSYINNLHPTKYAPLYKTLSKALEAIIPLLEQVLVDLLHPTGPRVVVGGEDCAEFTVTIPLSCYYYSSKYGYITDRDEAKEWSDWEDGIVHTEHTPKEYSKPDRPLPLPPTYSLRGEELQVVVEMETTYLTPEYSYCSKDEWRTLGTPNDNIVATAIWYYDVENTKISSIGFRDLIRPYDKYFPTRGSIAESVYHYVYNIGGIDKMLGWFFNQAYGFTGIKGGRVVCFPSSYQYTEPEMNLADPSKPGHVKKLYFHFVHPGVRVPSTSIVPPQQQEWWAGTVFSIPPMDSIPVELQTMILKNVDMPMSLKRAYEKYDRERYDKLCADEKAYNYYTWAFVYWRSLQREGYIQ